VSNTAYDNNNEMVNEELTANDIQHGIDDNPSGDAEKGATLGGVGGAVTGAVAGAMAGPLGALAGAVIGGVAGALASGAAVGAIDRVDNDNTVTGIGTGATTDYNDTAYTTTGVNTPGNGVPGIQTGGYDANGTPDTRGVMEKTADAVTGDRIDDKTGQPVAGSYAAGTTYGSTGVATPGNGVPGIQTGGYDVNGNPDTRGVTEKAADALTGDRIDDKTGLPVAGGYNTGTAASGAYGTGIGTATAYNNDPDGNAGLNQREELGETMPSIKTGGYANDGTPDTRGVGEKVVDAVTGDTLDDKTGRVVNHP